MKFKHFEELWESCESSHRLLSSSEDILNEILMKINLYKSCCLQNLTDVDNSKQIKARILGEILFAITKLSQKDNVNTFLALEEILNYSKLGSLI